MNIFSIAELLLENRRQSVRIKSLEKQLEMTRAFSEIDTTFEESSFNTQDSRKDYVRRVYDTKDLYQDKIEKIIYRMYIELSKKENSERDDMFYKGAIAGLGQILQWITNISLEYEVSNKQQ